MAVKTKEMEEADVIQHSNSNWNSPVVMVGKKTGEIRFCIDYRELNKKTVEICFKIPEIEKQKQQNRELYSNGPILEPLVDLTTREYFSNQTRLETLMNLIKLDHLPANEYNPVRNLLAKYSHAFGLSIKEIGLVKGYECYIDTYPGTTPVNIKPYKLKHGEEEIMAVKTKEMEVLYRLQGIK